jgi:acetyl-CoA acetyltransferase
MPNAPKLAALKDQIAVVGVGETDYAADNAIHRNHGTKFDSYELGARAFRNALTDCGLTRDDIDGLIVGPTLSMERMGEVLGLDARWVSQGDAVNAVMQAMLAIHAGLAECIALIYGNNQKSAATQYGGPNASGGERFLAYVYYAPWGLTSQGALYALLANRFMSETGFTPDDLGAFVIAQRRFAAANPRAIMRDELSLEQYRAGRLICEPLRLNDYCLINDGGVALIITTTDRAKRLVKPVVRISGIGRSDLNADATSLRPRLMDFYHSGHRQTAAQVYEMAGIGPSDVDVLQGYDSFSIHVPIFLEGFGFCGPGEAARFAKDGWLGPGGRLPLNTSGGMLSESYMQGWNHQVEAVRQLRGEAAVQTPNAQIAQYVSDVAGKVASIVYTSEFQ